MLGRPAIAVLAVGLGFSLVTVQPAPAADAAVLRPDLVVSAVTAAAEVRAGTSLTVSVTTKNRGRSRAAASITKVFLSADRAVGGDIAVATVEVPRLRPGRRYAARPALRVPAGAAARNYHLIACADTRKVVRESRERNNCRVADRMVRVTPATTAVPDFPLTPDPITVNPDPDDARAVSETIYDISQSTTIKATGADGTTYTLVIPAGALIGPETITLTPLTGVGNLPLSGGLEAAVQLQPHGLVLLKPGTLTIDSPNLGPIAQQTPFYFHEGGKDFHLYPVLLPKAGDDASVVRFPIGHFSTPGVGLASPADRANVMDHPAFRDQAQVDGQIADLLSQARKADPDGGGSLDPTFAQSFEAIMNSHYDGAVKPQLAAAELNPRNDALVRDAIADALAWARAMELHLSGKDGYTSARTQDAWDRIERVLKAVYLDRWSRCSQNSELEVLPHLLAVARQAALLGYAWADAAWERWQDCVRFEVRFDSRVSFTGTWPVGGEELNDFPHTGTGNWRAQAKVITDIGDGSFITQGPLSLTQASYHDQYSYPRSDDTICSGFSDQTASVPGILRAGVIPAFKTNLQEVPPGGVWKEPVVDLVISATPTGVKDIVRVVDCGGSDYTDTYTSRWQEQYLAFRNGSGTISLTGTKADRAGDLLYAKSWQHSESDPNHLGSRDWSETTVLEVWHKPVR